MSRRSKRSSSSKGIAVFYVLILLMIAATVFFLWKSVDLVNQEASIQVSEDVRLPVSQEAGAEASGETTQPPTEPDPVVSTATVAVTGDLLMHRPICEAYAQEDGTYEFSSMFQYVDDYFTASDYGVANLETTFSGPDYPYRGNPFNSPDSLMEDLVEAGFDMLLTANNHSADRDTAGLLRTVETVRSYGVQTLGTQLNDEEKKYAVVDLNGIKVGMICYTYATSETDGRPSLNYGPTVTETGIVNYFVETDLDTFYTRLQSQLEAMKEEGAELTMVYIHWGVEYELTQSPIQSQMAQKMCDLGVDVIVGGHPHVIQPMELLTSTTDAGHKTVCIYSLGNAVSNQRIAEMRLKTGHTEDGAIFTVTFERYADGSAAVADVNLIPTWVNLTGIGGKTEYLILPLDPDQKDQWSTLFNLNAGFLSLAQDSYNRTMDIVGSGLEACRNHLQQAKAEKTASMAG